MVSSSGWAKTATSVCVVAGAGVWLFGAQASVIAAARRARRGMVPLVRTATEAASARVRKYGAPGRPQLMHGWLHLGEGWASCVRVRAAWRSVRPTRTAAGNLRV